MIKIIRERPRKIDDIKLRRLWPTRMTECAIAKQMGHSKSVLRRRAMKLGLEASRKALWSKA